MPARVAVPIIIGAALLLYAVILADYSRSPFFDGMLADSNYYLKWGTEIRNGQFLEQAPFHQAPLYAFLLGGIYALFGVHHVAVIAVQVILHLGSMLLVFLIARRLFDYRIAFVSLGASILCGHLFFYSLKILPESMAMFFLLLSIYLSLESETWWQWLLTGCCVSIVTLLRTQWLLLNPAMLALIWFGLKGRSHARRIRFAAAYLAGAIVTIAPVTTMNYAKSGDFIPVSWNGGIVFYLGNSPNANGAFTPIPGVSESIYLGQRDVVALASRSSGRSLSPSEVSSYWYGKALEFMSAQPARYLRLQFRKLRYFLTPKEVSNMYYLDFERSQFSPSLNILLVGYMVVFPLFFVGLPELWQAPKKRLMLLVPVTVSFLTTMVYYYDERFRLLSVPFIMVTASAGLWRLVSSQEGRKTRIIVLLAATIVIVYCYWPKSDEIPHDSSMLYVAGMFQYQDGDIDGATRSLTKSLKLEMRYPRHLRDYAPAFGLALCLVESGDRDGAAKLYADAYKQANPAMRRMVDGDSDYGPLRQYVVSRLAETSRNSEAGHPGDAVDGSRNGLATGSARQTHK